jgi:hypothetical protein
VAATPIKESRNNPNTIFLTREELCRQALIKYIVVKKIALSGSLAFQKPAMAMPRCLVFNSSGFGTPLGLESSSFFGGWLLLGGLGMRCSIMTRVAASCHAWIEIRVKKIEYMAIRYCPV